MALSAAQVVQATLAPAFLISGTSVFLNFSQQRLFRVVDRIRATAKTDATADELPRLRRRVRILRNGIAFGVLTVALTVATAILVMATEYNPDPLLAIAAPVCLAAALLALLAALGCVFADTLLSVASVELAK